jgi:hypothetical protein
MKDGPDLRRPADQASRATTCSRRRGRTALRRVEAAADARLMNLALRSDDPAIQKIRDVLAALTQ